MRTIALLAALCCAAPAVADDDFTSIFNGKDLDGWKGRSDLWSVADGAITGKTTDSEPIKQNTFLVYEEDVPGDFELRCEYKIVGGNSGIQYRSRVVDEENFVVGGYQADIDSTNRYSGINYEERGRGILAERGQRVEIGEEGEKTAETFASADELAEHIKSEEWNSYRVVAKGNRLQHYINDELMSEVVDRQSEKSADDGVLALQLHQGPAMQIQFKEMRIKKLGK